MFQRWSKKGFAMGLASGVCVAFGLAMVAGADAPGDKPSDAGRYQLHVWAHQGSTPGDIGKHGAYRLDTHTGDVWIINARDEARKLEFK